MADHKWRRMVWTWVVPLATIVGFRSAIASTHVVPTGSMVPTIEVRDQILVSKLDYGLNAPWIDPSGGLSLTSLTTREIIAWKQPERGDVILFRVPLDDRTDYVKRVIGLPGDVISVRQNRLFINENEMDRVYEDRYAFLDSNCRSSETKRYNESLEGLEHAVLASLSQTMPRFGPVTVPPDQLFVMGDNRDHSADSRVWGMVPRENVRGRAVGIWMASDCEGKMSFDWESLR